MLKVKKSTKWIVGLVFLVPTILVILVAWLVARALVTSPVSERVDFCAPPATYCAANLIRDYGLEPVSVALNSWDGTQLSGYYFPSTNGAGVIVQHGYGGHRGTIMHIAKMLHDEGFGVLTMDLRGHGASGGEIISFGRDEAKDMQVAFDFLVDQPDIEPDKIGLYGWSLGGATVIMHAANNLAVKAVMADSPFDAIDVKNITEFVDLPWPLPSLVEPLVALRLQMDLQKISPLARISAISPRPVYLLVAGSDSVLNGESGLRLFAQALEPKKLWSEPAFDHVRFSFDAREKFTLELISFFNAYLLREISVDRQ